MNKRDKIAFSIYLIISLLGFAFGIAYLACSTIMQYHHQAIGLLFVYLCHGCCRNECINAMAAFHCNDNRCIGSLHYFTEY